VRKTSASAILLCIGVSTACNLVTSLRRLGCGARPAWVEEEPRLHRRIDGRQRSHAYLDSLCHKRISGRVATALYYANTQPRFSIISFGPSGGRSFTNDESYAATVTGRLNPFASWWPRARTWKRRRGPAVVGSWGSGVCGKYASRHNRSFTSRVS